MPRPAVTEQLRVLLGLLGLAGAVSGQVALQAGNPWLGAALLLPSTVAFVFAFRRECGRLDFSWHARPIRRLRSRLGVFVFIAAVLAGLYAAWAIDFTQPARAAWTLHAVAILGMLGAAASLDNAHPLPDLRRAGGRELAVLAVILLGALALRLYKIDAIPFGTWYDEAQTGLEAAHIINSPTYRPIYSDQTNATAYYLHFVGLAVRIFGENTTAVRLTSVVMGVGSVFAAWLAVRALLGPRAGLTAAAVVGFMRWDLTLSRIGMYNIATALFAFLAFGFLLRGWKRGSVLDYSLAGTALGVGLWTYSGFQPFAALLVLLMVLAALFSGPLKPATWAGPAFALIALAVVCAPLARFALDEPDVYFSRTKEASLFRVVPADERLDTIGKTASKHLQMFNYRSDKNGRHNLPGEPMLDIVTGALFILGLGVLLTRAKSPLALFLAAWIAVGLVGGILSLPFEAPQSLRSVAALPAVAIVAVLPLEAMARGPKPIPRWAPVWPAVIAGLLIVALTMNVRLYFGRQADDFAVFAAHSAAETVAADLMQEAGPGTDVILSALYDGHPTIRFLTKGRIPFERVETDGDLPVYRPVDRNILLLLDPASAPLVAEAQKLFPGAEVRLHRHAAGQPPVLYSVHLTSSELASIQGLEARYYDGIAPDGEPSLIRREQAIDLPWDSAPPIAGPFSMEMEGLLSVTKWGTHVFSGRSGADFELLIDEQTVMSGSGEVSGSIELAAGRHTLRLAATGSAEPLSVSWQQPGGTTETLGGAALYAAPVSSNGLLGKYFSNATWSEPPAYARIDTDLDMYFHRPVLERPYTVEWTGKVAIPTKGLWSFGLMSIDESTVAIDGVELANATQPNELASGTLELAEGLHDIVVRYTDRTSHTQVHLVWRPPGGTTTPVPSAALFPPMGSYERVKLPSATELALPPAFGPEGAQVATVLSTFEVVGAPRGIAAANGRIFVADPKERRVHIFDAAGAKLGDIKGGATSFAAPVAVDLGPAGEVVVLDADRGTLEAFDADGRYRRALTPPVPIGRSRNVTADDAGNYWIAATASGRLLAVNGRAEVVADVSLGPNSQPIDIAVATDGSLYVVDAGTWELLHVARDGNVLSRTPVAPANSAEGPQLLARPGGEVYLSDPSQGSIHRLGADGSIAASVLLRGPGGAARPLGIAAGPSSGQIWVADPDGRILLVAAPVLSGQ